MVDWSTAVTARYGIDPTARSIERACASWGWSLVCSTSTRRHGAVMCVISIPTVEGDLRQIGIGETIDEAAMRALVGAATDEQP